MNIVRKIKNRLVFEKNWWKQFIYLKKKYKEATKEPIIITSVPRHGNIGDHAILSGEIDFIKANFPNKELIQFPSHMMSAHMWMYNFFIKDTDLILITGGGFLGSLWMYEEKAVRNVIKTFKNNKIIIMPQTIYFEDSEWGRKEKCISKKIYNSHSNLTICMREKKSYKLAKEMFPNKDILLVPDMVIYLDYKHKEFDRKGILFCMRSDKEKTLSMEQEEYIYKILNDKFSKENINYTDTVHNYNISEEKSRAEVNNKIDEFAQSKLIITDRLHGMVLAAIAETPCVALGNCSGKVKGVYEWIKDLDYVEYVENIDDLDEAITKVMNSKNKRYDNENIKKYYDELIKAINE